VRYGRFPVGPIAVAWLTAFAALPALACGLCDEDKVAATYDARVVRQANARRHPLLFAALEGPVSGGPAELENRLRSALGRAPGVDPGTVRVSMDPPAISCAWNPSIASRSGIVAAAARALAGSGIRLRPIDHVVLPGAEPELRPSSRKR
jgi:hypothetical protein